MEGHHDFLYLLKFISSNHDSLNFFYNFLEVNFFLGVNHT